MIGEDLSFEHIKSYSKGKDFNNQARIPPWSTSHGLSQHDGSKKDGKGVIGMPQEDATPTWYVH